MLQQTFILAWRNIQNLINPAGFNTWLQKITLNQCYNLLRKKNIAILIDAESDMDDFLEVEESDELLPAVYAERDDLRFRLGKIIDGLSEVQKQTIVLFYFNEQKVEEIADIMECSVGTVKTRLFLARKAIRSEVEEEERKSGEKFYGIVGIPMLALSGLIVQQISYQVPYAEIHATALAALREAILQGVPMVGAPPAPPYGAPPYVPGSESLGTAVSTVANASYGAATAGNMATAAAVAKTSKIAGLSLTAKILIAVCAVALCAGLVYLGVRYFGGTETDEPFVDYDDYYENDIMHDDTFYEEDTSNQADEQDEVEEDVVEDIAEIDPYEIFGDLLDLYREIGEPGNITDAGQLFEDQEDIGNDWWYLFTFDYSRNTMPTKVTYVFHDINGNGIPDLILGIRDHFGHAIHTVVDGEIHSFDFNVRGASIHNRLGVTLLRDGIFEVISVTSTSWENTYFDFFRISDDGRNIEIIESMLYTWYASSNQSTFYRNGEEITEEEFYEVREMFRGVDDENVMRFDWRLLFQWS